MFLSWCWKTLFEIILGRHLYWDSVNASEKENLTAGVNLEQVWFNSVLSSLLSLIVDTSVLVCLFSQSPSGVWPFGRNCATRLAIVTFALLEQVHYDPCFAQWLGMHLCSAYWRKTRLYDPISIRLYLFYDAAGEHNQFTTYMLQFFLQFLLV